MLDSIGQDLALGFALLVVACCGVAALGGLLIVQLVRRLSGLLLLLSPKSGITPGGPIPVKATLYPRPTDPTPRQAIGTTARALPRPCVSRMRQEDRW